MAVFNNALAGAAGSGGAAGYEIERSLRFNSADSAYLSKTFGSAGNQTTWTLSCWFKISQPGTDFRCTPLFSGTQPWSGISIYQDNIRFAAYNGSSFDLQLQTTQKLRDPSAWYHLVAVYDSSNGTSTDRARLYLNGTRITDFGTATYPGPNVTSTINGTGAQRIGWEESNNVYSNCYFSDVHFIDGLALPPAFFGEYDDNGVWQPKEFTASGTTVNDGTTWSDSVSGTTASGWSKTQAFDGIIGSSSRATNGTSLTFTPSSAIPVNTSLRIYARKFGSGSSFLTVNGTDYTSLLTSSEAWITISETSITSIVWSAVSGNSDSVDVGAIEVDGVIMLDSTTQTLSYGTNGFHLDFADNSSAAALGYDAAGSNDWTVNNISVLEGNGNYGGTASGYITTPINALDGSLSTFASAFPAGNSGDYIFDNAITRTGTLKVYTGQGTGTGFIFYPSEQSYVAVKVDGTWNTVNASPGWSGDLSSFGTSVQGVRIYADVNSGSPGLGAIEINGVTLIDNSFSSGNDSFRDSPTNGDTANDTGAGGEVPGNYCTWNPLANFLTLSNGNLDVTQSSIAFHPTYGTFGISSGKWYWEITKNDDQSNVNTSVAMGIVGTGNMPIDSSSSYRTNNAHTVYLQSGSAYYDNLVYPTPTSSNSSTVHDAGVWMFAYDLDNNKGWVGKNGVWYSPGLESGGDPANGTNPIFTNFAAGQTYVPMVMMYTTTSLSANFGQRPFAYSAPSADFKALCTANLPDPDIADGSTAFEVITYEGNGTTQTLPNTDPTTSPQELKFSPDFVWIKQKSINGYWHELYDTVRTAGKRLFSNEPDGENTTTNLSAFTSDGFTLGSSDPGVNGSGLPYVAWTWDSGGQPTTDNVAGAGNVPTAGSVKIDGANMTTSLAGSIAATRLSANTTAGFSIVNYVGDGSSSSTVAHGLGVPLGMIFIKNRDVSWSWMVKHKDLSSGKYVRLNDPGAEYPGSSASNGGIANLTSSSTFGFIQGTNTVDQVNDLGENHIAYCWAPVESYSAFGSYLGGGTNYPFIWTGFKPRWVMIKSSSHAVDWIILDIARSKYNVMRDTLYPNLPDGEYSGAAMLDVYSNGFAPKATFTNINTSGYTYIYAAFAENPFKYARAR